MWPWRCPHNYMLLQEPLHFHVMGLVAEAGHILGEQGGSEHATGTCGCIASVVAQGTQEVT